MRSEKDASLLVSWNFWSSPSQQSLGVHRGGGAVSKAIFFIINCLLTLVWPVPKAIFLTFYTAPSDGDG